MLEEVTDAVNHLARPVALKIAPVLQQAQSEIEDGLREWLAKENGVNRFTTQRWRNALVAVRRANDTVRKLAPATQGALWVAAAKSADLAIEHIERELTTFEHIFEGSVHPVAIDAAGVITRGDKLLFKQFESSAKRYAGSIGESLQRELAVSRVKSETIFELTNRLQKKLPTIFQGERYSAERLARTETLQSYNAYHAEGLVEIAKDDPEILARWDASFDSRRCPACASLDGQVKNTVKGEEFVAEWTTFSKRTGKAKRHQIRTKHAPLHPMCRCVITPWRASWGDDWDAYARPRTPRGGPTEPEIDAQGHAH